MAASTPSVRLLELFQLQGSEGPCVDCFTTGQPVIVPDLEVAGARWPSFVPKAVESGFRSAHSFPMRLREDVIGTLNVFGGRPLPLLAQEVQTIQALADVATIALIQQQTITTAETLAGQLQGALDSRIVIEQAKGVVARSNALGVDDAFALIRSYARSHNLPLAEVARSVIELRLDPTEMGAST